MTAYADVPSANALHGEAEKVASALAVLNAGGTMVQFTVGPPAAAEGELPVPPVAIVAPAGTVQPATIDNLVAWLNQRQSDLTAQLASIGVT